MIHWRALALVLLAVGCARRPAPERELPEAALVSAPAAPFVDAAPDPVRIEAVEVPGDLRALALRGPHASRIVTVYLHGMCVYPGYYVESFMTTAAARGALVALQGHGSCGGDGFLHTWELDVPGIDKRIDAALDAVGVTERSGIVLVGYSQGADRAELLAAAYPAKYRAVVLIASSRPPSPRNLRSVRAAVLMAGTRDSPANARAGLAALSRANIPSTFIAMPDAWHGHMGSDPETTMGEALDFVEAHLSK